MDDARPAWPDDDWLAFLLGVDRLAHAALRTFDDGAWSAPPMLEAPPADELVDLLLGLDHLAHRVTDLLDRCAAAAPSPPPGPPPSEAPGSLLR